MSENVEKLARKKPQADSFLLGGVDEGEEMDGTPLLRGSRGAFAMASLNRLFERAPDQYTAATLRMIEEKCPEAGRRLRGWVTYRARLEGHKVLTYMMWLLATIGYLLEERETKPESVGRASASCHIGVAVVDQVTIDSGSWKRAWALSHCSDPPWSHIQRREIRTENPLPFSELFAEAQVAAVASWAKDMQTLAGAKTNSPEKGYGGVDGGEADKEEEA